MTEILTQYFNQLTPLQIEQFESMGKLYSDWNSKINVISRKDIDNLYERHILHSLAIVKFLGSVVPGTKFVDVGTGGGFPAIPLAICYPEASFHLIDRVAKKLRVAEDIANSLGLKNVTLQHADMNDCHLKFDFVISRAAMSLSSLYKLAKNNVTSESLNKYQNGIICLKGGDISEETIGIPYPVIEYPINEFFKENFFDTKKIIYVPFSRC